MRFKRVAHNALNRALNRPSMHRLIGPTASAVAIAQGERARITYDSQTGFWLKRTRGGITLMPHPLGMGAERCAEFTQDVFLHEYAVRLGDVVLDIGAGIGEETLAFSSMVGESGKVIAVEAHPATFAKLERVCELNKTHNVELVHTAVMDANQPVMISDVHAYPGAYAENRIGGAGIWVSAITMTDLVSKLKLDRIDLLKMNIEGAEVAALRGARDVLAIVRHAAISCHDFEANATGDESLRTKEAVHALLIDAGFNVLRRDGDPRPAMADYLFASR